jgi:TetR/AcrR family transcriptional regulator
VNDVNTEQRILAAAKKTFLQKGMNGARMQEIADTAGINKALLHYYFRNKEQLFRAVFQTTIGEMLPQLFGILTEEAPLEVKVYQLADKYIDFLTENKQLPLFVLSEIQRDPDQLFANLDIGSIAPFDSLQKQLDEEVAAGNIIPISAKEFVMNFISMAVFPFIARPMIQKVMNMPSEAFEQMMEKRKKQLPAFFMNALRI